MCLVCCVYNFYTSMFFTFTQNCLVKHDKSSQVQDNNEITAVDLIITELCIMGILVHTSWDDG